MPLTYNGNTMGTLTICQRRRDKERKEFVVDEKGKPVYNKFRIQIRQGNCLAVFIHVYKDPEPEDPKRPWVHQLQMFFANEQHIKNCLKEYTFENLFNGLLKNIRLNLFYSECRILLKYFTQQGLNVQCYYKDPAPKRKKKS